MKQLFLALIMSAVIGLSGNTEARDGQKDVDRSPGATATAEAPFLVGRTGSGAWQPVDDSQPVRLAASSADRALLREIQERLITLGYDPGPADGLMGWRTRRAIHDFQRSANLRVDGEPNGYLLDRLRRAVAAKSEPRRRDRRKQRRAKEAPTTDLDQLVQQLTQSISEAKRSRRAEPAFLTELAEILRPYQRPTRRKVLNDNFSDGNFTHDPSWTVASGNFTVSANNGLSSSVARGDQNSRRDDRPEDIAVAILSQILSGSQQQARQTDSRPQSAEVSTRVGFSNDFELKASVLVRGDSVCDLGVFDATGQGYFLSLSGGQNPVLVRRSGGRTEIISRSTVALQASRDAVYDIRWSRNARGNMRVRLAEGAEIRARDDVVGGDFAGVLHSNRSGQCSLRAVSVIGTV